MTERTMTPGEAAWRKANSPTPSWGWDALPNDEKAAWAGTARPTGDSGSTPAFVKFCEAWYLNNMLTEIVFADTEGR